MSPAETSPWPATSRRSLPGRSTWERRRTPLMFRRMSDTCSLTWSIVAYSWRTPSILTDVTAAPFSEP